MGKGKRPPEWREFDRWVWAGAFVGVVIAFGLFCIVQLLVNDRAYFFAFAGDDRVPLNDIISMTATAIGGLAIGGVAVMQYRKHKWAEYQAKLDEDSRTGERLSKAIEHLGDGENLHIRLGAIYEFDRLAKDSPRDKENIVKILTAFIKARHDPEKELEQDVEAAANVLSQLTRELIEETAAEASKRNRLRPPKCVFEAAETLSGFAEEENGKLKNKFLQWNQLKVNLVILVRISLKGADLDRAHLEGADLNEAHLEGAMLSEAHLKGSFFFGAHLEGALLYKAHFKGANLRWARLEDAYLESAYLEGAKLRGAYLKGADLRGAYLKGADLRGAHLEGAKLRGAHLEGADLSYAYLEGADLGYAHFEGADLNGAHLEGADLRGAYLNGVKGLDKAQIDDRTRFDPGVRLKYFGVEEPEHPED